MAANKPMLDDIELQQVQKIEVDEDQVLAQQSVPALEGDFLQRLGRRGTQISLTGVLTGAEAGAGLKTLQEKFRAAAPVSFVADIATATQVEKVLIEEMGIRELAGKPARFEYALTLREFTPPPAPEPVPPPPPTPPPPPVETGTLVVDVTVEGQPGFDFSKVTVSVEGTQDDGTSLTRTLTNRSNNSWTEENMPPGKYTVKAVVTDPQSLSGAATVTVSAGQTANASITLQSGSLIAKAFVVHFRFDKAFVEPCMLDVLKTVVTYANAHTDEKLVIVGHTDLISDPKHPTYNQSLSERRGRSVYAALSYGRDKATALVEWNALRHPTDGALPSIKDSWGVYEYQYMLQDLDFYSGNIDGVQGPETDAAVRDFQGSKGLTVDGIVGDQTWSALIEAYLDQYNLTIPETQFLPNCGGEILKWLGCGEQDPVKNTQDAWRPNRRTELLFVKASTFPCKVPQPDTFNLPPAGAVGSKWCLGPGDKNQRNCFATRKTPEQGKWLIQPVEPETITVSGSIMFEDGTPAANMKYVLIASDGEFMDGEVAQGADHGKPIPSKTKDDGSFGYPNKPKGVGIYTLEIIAPVVARTADEPPEEAKGNVICKRLDTTTEGAATQQLALAAGKAKTGGLPAVVLPGPVKGPTIKPHIDLASPVVVVKKSYTNPARQAVTLRSDAPFAGKGTFTRTGTVIRFFNALAGGTEIKFNGADNVFTGAQLTAPGGVKIFAEGVTASKALDDIQLTLKLTAPTPPPPGGAAPPKLGPPATAKMTAVELDLDICMSRTADATDPKPLPQPPAVPPPPATASDKWFGGRTVHVQVGNHHGRALLLVHCKPAAFKGQLVLQQVVVAGNTVTGPDTKVQVFDSEFGGAAKLNPHEISTPIAGGVSKLWAEGHTVSGALGDTGFQLGIKNLEADGDRVRMTVARLSNLRAVIPATQPNTLRLVNGPVNAHQFSIGTAVAPVASDFDVDFVANKPLVLVEGSVLAANPINLSVVVAPVGVPVLWDVQRDTRPAPDGDHNDIITLSPIKKPTLVRNALNPLIATLQANAVGSFHILPFIDCNGNGKFDATKNREPFIIMNLVLIRVGGPGSTNSSIAQPANIALTPAVPTSATGVVFSTGGFASAAAAGVHNNATVVVVGGGHDGTRGLDRLFAGWINNTRVLDIGAGYRDATPPPPPRRHQRNVIFTSVGPGTIFGPGAVPPPAPVPPPLLDTTNFGNEGQGGNLAVGTEGAVGPPVGITKTPRAPIGQSWQVQMWDSPGFGNPAAHEIFPGNLVDCRFNVDFSTELCFWTNSVLITPAPTPGPVTGAVVPDAACCLYTSVQSNRWSVRLSFTFNPVTGVGIPGARTITMSKDPSPTRLARQPAGHEVRGPAALTLAAIDDQT